ncbi:NAD+ synthase [Spirochaetota bacterium]
MKIAICQTDTIIADFSGNSEKILAFSAKAKKAGAELVIFPELCISAYPPMDLMADKHFIKKEEETFKDLVQKLPSSCCVVIGHIGKPASETGQLLTNRLSVIQNNKLVFQKDKENLPNHCFFNEKLWFTPGNNNNPIWTYKEKKIVIMQEEEPEQKHVKKADLVIISANSAYEKEKLSQRIEYAKKWAARTKHGLVFCNAAGAQDSLVFDGRSFFMNPLGEIMALAQFEEDLLVFDSDEAVKAASLPVPDKMDELENALIAGIKGYMNKCGFKKAHLGLSGGLDSAIVAVLAAKAIGKDNLCCITLPSRFSSASSIDDSMLLAKNIGCRIEKLSIEGPFSSFLTLFEPYFSGLPFNVAEENLQARIRGNILMAWSNKFDSMLLTTSNKSEFAMGYSTLYGDMCGSIAPMADLFKTEVYALCEHIYAREGLIPRSIIDKAPSAELRPGQLDEDSLPPYKILDKILYLYLEQALSAEEISAMGFDKALVIRIISYTIRAEYKRRQAALLIKTSKSPLAGPGIARPLARKLLY